MFLVSWLIGIWDLKSDLIMLVEPVTLKSIHANGGLQIVFKVNETQQVLSACGSGFPDQADLLESWVRPEHILALTKILRLTYRSVASLGIPST